MRGHYIADCDREKRKTSKTQGANKSLRIQESLFAKEIDRLVQKGIRLIGMLYA